MALLAKPRSPQLLTILLGALRKDVSVEIAKALFISTTVSVGAYIWLVTHNVISRGRGHAHKQEYRSTTIQTFLQCSLPTPKLLVSRPRHNYDVVITQMAVGSWVAILLLSPVAVHQAEDVNRTVASYHALRGGGKREPGTYRSHMRLTKPCACTHDVYEP